MFCLTLFEGLLLGKQKVVSSHFFHNWLLFVWLCYICYGTVVLQFVLNEMRWSILRLSAGLDPNHAWWHVSIHDNISHAAHNLCGSVPISGLNIIKSFLTEIINMLVLGDQDEVRWQDDTIQEHCSYSWADSGPGPWSPWSLHWWTITILHRADTGAPGLSVAINRITRTCPIMSWPGTCHGVIQSNHFTPEQHFDASEDYWTTTGSVVKLSPGLMFQRGYLSHERDQSADGETIRIRSSWD